MVAWDRPEGEQSSESVNEFRMLRRRLGLTQRRFIESCRAWDSGDVTRQL
jgi:hypothetical protein